MEIVFLKEYEINGKTYNKGEKQKVYDGLAEKLIKEGIAEKKPKSKKLNKGE